MRLRRLLVAIFTAVLSLLAIDRHRRRFVAPLPPATAGRPDTIRVDGHDIAVTETGDPAGRAVVLVHTPAVGGSSREFTPLAEALAEEYRVILIDLPGFGRSGRPHLTFDATRLADAIEAVVTERTDDPVVVASGHAVPPALIAARRTPLERVVAIGPRIEHPHPRPLLAAGLSTPVLATILRMVVTSRPLLRAHLATTYEVDPTLLDGDHLDYAWQSAHQDGSFAATAAYVGGDLDAVSSLDALVASAGGAVSFVVGAEARHPTVEAVRETARTGDVSVSVVTDTGAFPHVTQPAAVAAHLAEAELLQ